MIVHFQLDKIQAQSYKEPLSNHINMSHEINMTNPTVIRQSTAFGEKSVLRVEYRISINYLNPAMGYMVFEGTSDYFSENDNLEVIRKEWDDVTNKIANEAKNEFSSVIFQNIIPFAMIMSQRLSLPPILPIPRVVFGAQKREEIQDYIQ